MQTLGVSQRGGHRFDRGTRHVVERILFGQRPTGSLRVRTQRQRFRIFRVELLDDLRPQQTGGAHLGDLHKMIHADSPEERQPRSERIDAHAGINPRSQVLQTVGQRISQLDVGRSPSLLHVVAGDRDRVELRHILRRVLENIGDDLQRKFGRVNISIAHHELLQDVVLDRTAELVERAALLQTGHDVERQHRQYGAVHRHRDGHLIQRNAVEQHLHILHRADRHAGLADVADYARMIGVVTAVRSEVERHRKPFLAGSQVTAIERVRFGRGRKTGVLTDRPRTHHVHRTVRTAQERRDTGGIIQVLHAFEVFGRIGSFHGDVLGSYPGLVFLAPFRAAALCRGACIF